MVAKEKRKILLYFNNLQSEVVGGSEVRLLWILENLKENYELTLLTAHPVDWDKINELYGCRIDPDSIRVRTLSPKNKLENVIERVFQLKAEYIIQKEAQKHDYCISCTNMIEFNRPAMHFIFMVNFDWELWEHFTGERKLPYFPTGAKKVFRMVANWLKYLFLHPPRKARGYFFDSTQTIYANSSWVAASIHNFYGCRQPSIVYPPVLMDFPHREIAEREDGFVYIGRIHPHKQIDGIIEIVRQVRLRTGNSYRFHLAGYLGDDDYGQSIRNAIADNPWIVYEGVVCGEKKRELLLSQKYALHLCGFEAFGISVAEYIKAGIVPVVTSKGGAAEIIDDPDLHFESIEEAIEIQIKLCTDSEWYRKKTERMKLRAMDFTRAAFEARLKQALCENGIKLIR